MFDAHYTRGEGWVQEVLYAPQVPYLHGLTMPTASGDCAINAICHSVLLMPTRCPGKSCCKHTIAHSQRYIKYQSTSKTLIRHYFAQPVRTATFCVGPRIFSKPWTAFEAHKRTLTMRACTTNDRSRKVPTMTDTTSARTWFCPGADESTMLQRFVLPWLQGACRHIYQ